MGLDRVAQAQLFMDTIMVAAAIADRFEVAPLDQIRDDALDCPFGDAHAHGYSPHAQIRVLGQDDQDVRVVG